MPPKTCKVVLKENQRGARIAPKGCKVRTKIEGGVKTSTNKDGQIKRKVTIDTTTERELVVRVRSAANVVGQLPNVSVPMSWDTGAEIDTISYDDAVKLKILDRPHYRATIDLALNMSQESFEVRNVPIWVRLTAGTPYYGNVVSRRLFITPGKRTRTSNVIGTVSIAQLSKVFKVKFI